MLVTRLPSLGFNAMSSGRDRAQDLRGQQRQPRRLLEEHQLVRRERLGDIHLDADIFRQLARQDGDWTLAILSPDHGHELGSGALPSTQSITKPSNRHSFIFSKEGSGFCKGVRLAATSFEILRQRGRLAGIVVKDRNALGPRR